MPEPMHIPYLPNLQPLAISDVAEVLAAMPPCGRIDCVNWSDSFPAHPITVLHLAHTGTILFARFDVEGRGLRAMHTHDLEHVNEDSCVEFFVTNADQSRYFNFEFNCIGVCNASHRISKSEDVHRLTPDELHSILRYSSVNSAPQPQSTHPLSAPFDLRDGDYCWSLTIGIPLSLLGITPAMFTTSETLQTAAPDAMPDNGFTLHGNFYKCGDLTSEPHYLSWAPVTFEHPNFHLPAFFGNLILEPIGQIPYSNHIAPTPADHGNKGSS